MKSFKQYLNEGLICEKQIVINNRARYGQVLIVAGGGGSGKGFAIDNFIDSSSYKIIDVDAMKQSVIELDKLKKLKRRPINPKTGEPFRHPKDLKLSNPKDVFELHAIVAALGVKIKLLNMLLDDNKDGRLPNILYDITGQDKARLMVPILESIHFGYDPKDISLVWVLSNYSVAVNNNASRERIVPDDILLQTHEGAANTITQVLNGKSPDIVSKKRLDGDIHVILNNRENTIFFTDKDTRATAKNGKQMDGQKLSTVKSFTSIKVKGRGKAIDKGKKTQATITKWVRENIPKTDRTKGLF